MSDTVDSMLKKLKNKALVNMWMQNGAVHYYNVMYNLLSYPVILISCLSTAAIFSDGTGTTAGIRFASGGASILSALLTAITRQMRPAELSEQHSQTCRRYERLVRMIDVTLMTPVSARPRAEVLLDRVRTEFDSVVEMQLDPPVFVVWRFGRAHGGTVDELLYGTEMAELVVEKARTSSFMRIVRSKTPTDLVRDLQRARGRGEVMPAAPLTVSLPGTPVGEHVIRFKETDKK